MSSSDDSSVFESSDDDCFMYDPIKENIRRYQNLKLGEALSKIHLYPFACGELISVVLDLGYSRFPKYIKALIFQDTLFAFRLLPQINTSAAVSTANLLLKNVEAVLPKQKKKLVIVEFKQAKVALKRRSKSHEEDIDIPSLPQDILIHIFSFLDVSSLLSSAQVSRSWNQATHENSLWQSQFDLLFNQKDLIKSGTDWREAFKKAFIAANLSESLRSGRGYCTYCHSIVWHDNLRCPNQQCRLKSGNSHILSSQAVKLEIVNSSDKCECECESDDEVVNYLPGIVSSSSDDEDVPGLWQKLP